MAEEKRRKSKPVRQKWEPHWVISILHKIWMALFAAAKIAIGAAATVLLICVVCAFVFVGILADYLQEDVMPSAGVVLENYDMEETSFLYHVKANGDIEVLQNVYGDVSRQHAELEEIPEELIHAAIAIEDKRFYEHQGVDWFTTVKAVANMFFGSETVGGSSITQQLIKNVTDRDSVTVQRKVLEFFDAVYLEKRYDKDTIMEAYMNYIYLGQGCRGVKSAAATYFGKEIQSLTLAECASLISITNNPSLFDPYSDNVFEYKGEMMNGMQRNRYRQEIVLDQMLAQGWITEEEHAEALAQDLVLKNGIDDEDRWTECVNESCRYEGIAGTFVTEGDITYCPKCGNKVTVEKDSSQEVYSWFVEAVLEDVARDLAEKDGVEWNDSTSELYMEQISRSGYHIYTTLDMEVQNQVDAIYQDLEQIPDTYSAQQLESGIVVIDNRTGDIVALSGGVGEKTVFDAYSVATDSRLQSGSAIKPLSIYAPAFEAGTITPATVIKDLPYEYEEDEEGELGPWPWNDNRRYAYSSTIYSGITRSVNTIATNTLNLIGTRYAYTFAKEQFGLSTLIEGDNDYAPLAMGAQTDGITIRDMASAYATFANSGIYREGRTYTKVYDSDGNLILDNTQDSSQILSQKAVDYTNYCLTNAVESLYGTGRYANDGIEHVKVAGKTGTTSSNRDKWFCGFTGYYTAAVWCGYRYPEEINLVSYANGSNPAVTLWNKVMAPLHEDKASIALYDSKKMGEVTICLDSGMIATEACEHDIRGSRVETVSIYKEDRANLETCTKHVMLDYCTVGDGVATEYCKRFAELDTSITFQQTALVKMTADEIAQILQAEKFNLEAQYLQDNYVYLVNDLGEDADFKGFHNDINQNVTAPYEVCKVHTKAAWEAHQATLPTRPAPTTPEETIPGTTTDGSGDSLLDWIEDLLTP